VSWGAWGTWFTHLVQNTEHGEDPMLESSLEDCGGLLIGAISTGAVALWGVGGTIVGVGGVVEELELILWRGWKLSSLILPLYFDFK